MTWKDPSRYIEHIYVEESCLDMPFAQEILQRSQLPWKLYRETEKPFVYSGTFEENLTLAKKNLVLSRYKGVFLKDCPGTREYCCCGYSVLTTGMNCPIDCVYCILQAYLNTPWISVFVNMNELLQEVDAKLKETPEKYYRIGTGEFADSLALDRLTHVSRILVPFFAKQKNAVLELKTKSAMIDNLADLNHQRKTIISWSLNSTEVMKKEEFRAATLVERLTAARQCVEWGYPVAFHFDPILEHEGWQKSYAMTIHQLFEHIPAQAIRWISLVALRYIPKLKTIAGHRFPNSTIYHNEFIDGLDGKQRYFRFSRQKLYANIYNELKKYADSSTCIYFCMESDEMWQAVMGYTPAEKGGLPLMLDTAAKYGIQQM